MYTVVRAKYLFPVLLSLLLLCPVTVALYAQSTEGERTAAATAATVNWGLSFPTPGQPPVGNATADALAQYNAYFVGPDEKTIYLTFDAGFENGHTSAILDVLKRHEVPAAFFLVGNYLQTQPELVKRMVAEGHIVGNHTYHHPNMAAIASRETFEEELTALERLYTDITGQPMPKFYRPPQGIYNEQNLRMAQELGYTTVFWSLAYVDWYTDQQPTHQQAFDKLLPRMHNGAVVLLHSTSQTNAEILDELLTRWKADGYTFGTLYELTAA